MNALDRAKIAEVVSRMHLPVGLGDDDNACSIAAINLALTGELADLVPECMSDVIGQWIIVTQDEMPDEMRNSARWKALLPLAAGTGRDHEVERLAIILSHMWGIAAPLVQPTADRDGFGVEWRTMLSARTEAAAWDAGAAAGHCPVVAQEMAYLVVQILNAVSTARAAWDAARAAALATFAAHKSTTEAWNILDPCSLLERLIAVSVTDWPIRNSL